VRRILNAKDRVKEAGLHIQYCNTKDQEGALSRAFVLGLRDAFGVKSFVETGTYLGGTLAKLCDDFDSLDSIELSSDYYAHAMKRFAKQRRVRLTNADSASGLQVVLKRLSLDPAIIWLDAHYSGGNTAKGQSNTPIKIELGVVVAQLQRNDIVLIDDLRLFSQPSPGSLHDETMLGYPLARDLVGFLNSGPLAYDCFALSDALLAVPAKFRDRYTVSPLLPALTQSRLGLVASADLVAVERLIADASGPERDALIEIPDYLARQPDYGVAGHYFYWRALVHLGRGQDTLARADADVAAGCGVIPDGSLLAKL
jgi:hypothetical protein